MTVQSFSGRHSFDGKINGSLKKLHAGTGNRQKNLVRKRHKMETAS